MNKTMEKICQTVVFYIDNMANDMYTYLYKQILQNVGFKKGEYYEWMFLLWGRGKAKESDDWDMQA